MFYFTTIKTSIKSWSMWTGRVCFILLLLKHLLKAGLCGLVGCVLFTTMNTSIKSWSMWTGRVCFI